MDQGLRIEITHKRFSTSKKIINWRRMDTFFMTVTWAGSVLFLGPLTVLLSALLYLRRNTRGSLLILGSFSGAMLLSHIIKIVVARPRPAIDKMLVSMPDDFSFPSAHTSQICAFLLSCILVSSKTLPGKWKELVWAGATLVILLVAISRVYLGVHYISDVVAGALLAIGWVLILCKVLPDATHEL
jgi:membrane-associated phospholipid phosphatase